MDTPQGNAAYDSATKSGGSGPQIASPYYPVSMTQYHSPIGPEPKPVSVLSTENAKATLDQKLNRLNTYSPQTVPGYGSTFFDPATGKAQGVNKFDPNTGEALQSEKPAPKAYFQNEAGQEAEFTQEQLNDPKNQSFLSSGGYVQSRTEGPNFNPASPLSDDLTKTDNEIKGLIDSFKTYSVDSDPAFQTRAQSITAQFDSLRQALSIQNDERMKSYTTLGYRTGATQYAGGTQLGLLGEELRQGNQRMADLSVKEAGAISDARAAYQTGKYQEFNQKVNLLEKVRSDKKDTLDAYNKTLSATIKKVQDTTIRSSRDATIAGILGQGITDPKQILNYLNYDKSGAKTGNFTADEISKAIKDLAPEKDSNKFTGAIGEYFALKEHGVSLPASIASLPEEQQPFAYAKYKADLARKPTTPTVKITRITPTNRGKLLATGNLTDSDVNSLEQDISAHGINAVLNNPDSGLSDAQKDLLRSEYAANKKSSSSDIPSWLQ